MRPRITLALAWFIAICLLMQGRNSIAQSVKPLPPGSRAPVPDDPLRPIPQTDKPLIDDVGLLKEQPPSPDAPNNGGPEPAIPTTLDKALARALHANPDMLLAIARLDEARAQRDQSRLKVVEQVTATVNAYSSVTNPSGPPLQLQVEGRTLDRFSIGAGLGYLLGAGGDEPLEELKKKSNNGTNAETLARNVHRNLGKSLERALQSNPDLRLADAKVRGAEAELNQIRLATARKVAVAFHRRQNDKEAMLWSKANLDAGLGQMEQVLAARQSAAESEAELLYLMGVGADTPPTEPSVTSANEPKIESTTGKRPELPKKLQEALSKKVSWQQKPANLFGALNLLSSRDLRIVASNSAAIYQVNIATVDDVPLLSILEMIADQAECAFIVRDYGLLAVPRGEAWQYPGAAIPRDLPLGPQR